MTEQEFFYWLQGFFEISDAGVSSPPFVKLSIAQLDCIRRHAALVRANCEHVSGTFIAIESLTCTAVSSKTEEIGRSIRELTSLQFHHVIDPSYGDADKQAELNRIHAGNDQKPPSAVKPVQQPAYPLTYKC